MILTLLVTKPIDRDDQDILFVRLHENTITVEVICYQMRDGRFTINHELGVMWRVISMV